MSRLHLIFIPFFLLTFSLSGQTELKQILKFAEEQYEKGDYYYAKEYYEKALLYDSSSVSILWKYAETLRAYQDYPNAARYYGKVYEKEEARLYPNSLIYYGMMLKQSGNYEAALEVFKRAKKRYARDKRGFAYKKSREEISACVWAKSTIDDSADVVFTNLPETVNTKNAEFGHLVFENKLLFSSLRADSVHTNEEVYENDYHTHLYYSDKQDDKYTRADVVKELFYKKMNSGNGSFSLDGKRFYFSLCSEGEATYRCKIMVARYEDGRWADIDSLGEIINEPGTTTTQPAIGEVMGDEWLFFASNREDSKGGMDIYFSVIKNGNQYGKVKNFKSINTMGNEVTPYFDRENKVLYFSSDFHEGYGGFDVFEARFENNEFSKPKNLGVPVNSPANDLYYFTYGDTAYVSSNRIGSLFSKNPTCCSDIFKLYPTPEPEIEIPEETLEELNARLPVTLYFHNDIPNPRSWDTTTTVNYIDSYNDYTQMLPTYQKEYAKGLGSERARDAEEDIEDFFIEYVDQGVRDLQLFRDLLLKELQKGAKINVQVKGFASPLAKTDYNVNLTKRRIASLVNYLRAFGGGVFAPFMTNTAENGGRLVFTEIPFGEYVADQLISDNPNDKKNSVYSRAAAMERKIEIQSVTFIVEEDSLIQALTAEKRIIDAGVRKPGEKIEVEFSIRNQTSVPVKITAVTIPCNCIAVPEFDREFSPGETVRFKATLDTSDFMGHTVKSIEITTGYAQNLELMISVEVKE